MVIISAGIGTLINYLIKRSQTPENLMYCSNNNSLTSDGWPIWNSSDPRVYGINDTTADGSPPLKSVNFYYFYDTASLLSSTSAPGASLLSAKHSCVFWFGDEYPQNSKIYELNANLNASGKIDSTYIPPPDGGWIAQFTKLLSGSGSFDTTAFSQFLQFQQASWAIVGAKSGLEPALGFLNNVGPISEAQATVLLQNVTHILEPTYSVSSGLLGAVSQRAYINLTDSSKGYSLSNLALVPYFVRNNSLSSDDDLDTLLQEYLDDIIVGLAALNKSILLQPSKDQSAAALEAFYLSADAITAEMPYG
ncbi:hypothetical protein HK100_001912 [Physocladia obscura]|uniref:Uncharacterized protein n=1 Tax=Physocladia obscura TaxID=109957 RepID=A0AAD5SW33_9FUNG|nr:hypothetical protein HK100_001912 [Physocladia obscura]